MRFIRTQNPPLEIYEVDTKQIPPGRTNHNILGVIFPGIAFKSEKKMAHYFKFQSTEPIFILASVAVDDGEQFQCLNEVLNNKTVKLDNDSVDMKTDFSFLKRKKLTFLLCSAEFTSQKH